MWKIGQRNVICTGLFTIIASVLLVAFSKTYTILLIGMFLINMGYCFCNDWSKHANTSTIYYIPSNNDECQLIVFMDLDLL